MDPSTAPEATSVEHIRFRAGKKRKGYRQRSGSEEAVDSNLQNATATTDKLATSTNEEEEEESTVQAALRIRNARRGRLQGVSFKADGKLDDQPEQSLVLRSQEDDSVAIKGISDRFMHQTGLITELNDKHMTAYIESRLTNRNAVTAGDDDGDDARSQLLHPQSSDIGDATRPFAKTAHASLGKLQEVDLQDISYSQKQRGTKRPGDAKAAEVPEKSRRKYRNRRNSDDIKRDQLVEAFLHENKLDVYDVPKKVAQRTTVGGSSADEHLAEEFKRQYMEEAAIRRQRRRPAINQPKVSNAAQQAASEEILRGPKLGGSRNVRAAVRNALLQQQEQAKKS